MSQQGDQDGGRLGELLGRYVEQSLVHGVHMDPEELCRDDPALLGPLLECIREYEQLDRLLAAPRGLAGRNLLHYRILVKLGAGGMGQVYAAEDTKLGRRVAVKVLAPEMAAHPERLERFRREARIVAALNHPNIVTLFSVEEAGGVHFLTMELVEGKTLDAWISPGGQDPGTILDVAGQLVDALVAAHERGIVHRDLKPANVMVSADGRLKILDFGLAKLRASPESGEGADSARTLTMEGRLVGTVPYMSPEQVLGRAVDSRTDLFSLGVILYQMATGRHPFHGAIPAEQISSILRDAPVPISELRDDFPPALERIVLRLLEKEPERRFQTALEVRDELRQLEPQADGSQASAKDLLATVLSARRAERRRALTIAAAFVAVLAIAWGGWIYLGSGWPAPGAARSAPAADPKQQIARHGRASLAVLHFRNLTGDPELDWLSSGITEMLVTDLSQSPEIYVLSTDRLYQVLKDLNALEQTALPLELIRKVGSRAGVETMVRGSYARLGDVFRIALTIEGAADGTTLTSKHVEGRGEESLFALVDELGAAVRNSFEIERPAASPATIQAATTSSLEAWRFYSEAVALSNQSKRAEAIVLLEKAVEIDPSFARALAYLGTLHDNLGHTVEAREYKRRAFELADRLPLDERYQIETTFYSTWATLGRSIEIHRQGLKLYPDRTAWRGSLAWLYAYVERYEEAIEELAGLPDYPGNYTLAADAYAALGRFEMGYRVLSDFAGRHPENWSLQLTLGWLLIEWGKLDAAAQHLERAARLRPFDYNVPYGRWRLHVRREDWPIADAAATEMARSGEPRGRWRGAVSRARNLAYRGRTAEALRRFDEAIQAFPAPDGYTALARCWKAELLLQRGEAAQALAEARRAQEEGRDEFPELKGLFLAALAEQQLGHPAAAEALEKTLQQKWESHPNRVEERQLHHLAGLLALARGDAERAVRALTRAASLLPPKGIEIHWHVYPDHVPIWFALGQAELAAGREREARGWFERVANASEHVEQPVPYVRSFYFLGRIGRQSGEVDDARRSFERFLRFWRDGDLDRERVEEALAASR